MRKDYFELLKLLREAKAAGITTAEIREWLEVIGGEKNRPQSRAGLEAHLIGRIEAKYK